MFSCCFIVWVSTWSYWCLLMFDIFQRRNLASDAPITNPGRNIHKLQSLRHITWLCFNLPSSYIHYHPLFSSSKIWFNCPKHVVHPTPFQEKYLIQNITKCSSFIIIGFQCLVSFTTQPPPDLPRWLHSWLCDRPTRVKRALERSSICDGQFSLSEAWTNNAKKVELTFGMLQDWVFILDVSERFSILGYFFRNSKQYMKLEHWNYNMCI